MKWTVLSDNRRNEKVDVLNQLETKIASIEHRPPCPITAVKLKSGLWGGYNPVTKTIDINRDYIDISEKLTPILEEWLNDENCQKDYSIEGHSIQEFLEDGMKYPAAVLTMDWLIKDPQVALKSLTKGIR